jgi:LacI family transcriptional regulator
LRGPPHRWHERRGRGRALPEARRRAVTIKHVAAEAGVSLQTVSRVINDGPNVRDEIKERVRTAIARLGYVPSLAARRMGGSRSFLLLALNDRDRTIEDWRSGQGKDWVDQMLFGGMLKCAEHGYRMIFELVDTHTAHVEREIMGALSALHPDGVILTPPHSDNPLILALLTDQRIPFARIGSVADGAGFSITMDEQAAGAAATAHLIGLGHRRIGFITGSDDYALSAARLEGYRQAMRDAGLPQDATLVARGDFSFGSGRVAAETLLALPEPPTGIVASSDQMALATVQVATAQGMSVPGDLSVVSFDDSPLARFSTPPLTAIVQPIAAMTARAAELLIVGSAGEGDGAERSVLPFALAARDSTAAPRR